MEDSSRIDTFKQWLRVKYNAADPQAADITALRAYITALGDGDASDAVAITQLSFESGQASGQLVLEPMARLNAALTILGEIDPDNTPPVPSRVRFANFGYFPTET